MVDLHKEQEKTIINQPTRYLASIVEESKFLNNSGKQLQIGVVPFAFPLKDSLGLPIWPTFLVRPLKVLIFLRLLDGRQAIL